ncbi:GrpB family protein [Methanoculleus horonobensis]|uniref:GrpB family protein n=1 Tax=Methanoculleus horonobensis TaxID=528314 RepID=UPI000A4A7433|nr:GrpB family protein [Methanoculleus horonobensis]
MSERQTDPSDATVLDYIHVRVVEYDPAWPELFRTEARLIEDILKENLVEIFHIGSTSVPGLRAKPIIDIMPAVLDIEQVDERSERFEAIGYETMGELGIPGRRYFRKGGENRTHQIHAFQFDNVQNITRHLAFRDYLRCRPEISRAYAALKSELAARYPRDIGQYCDGKDGFIKRVERDALQWYWKQYGATGRC